MNKLILLISLFLSSTLFAIEEADIPKSVYRIEVINDENKTISIGTGWLINGKDNVPYLVSCAHVLTQVGFKVRLEPGKGEHTTGEVVHLNNVFDVGVVKITGVNPGVYNEFSKKSPEIGDTVFGYGANREHDPQKTKVGTIEREMEIYWFRDEDKNVGAAGRRLRLTFDVEKGNSGGPVYDNETFEIVGMLASMSAPIDGNLLRGKAGMLTFEFITSILKKEGYIENE